jgi:NhaP-type Na+/H+ or K+/H+ antiporter
MENPIFFWMALAAIGLTLLSARMRSSFVTAPMLMVAAGALLGPALFESAPERSPNLAQRTLVELAIALLVFIGAARLEVRRLRSHWKPVALLLLVAMPLSLVLATLLGLVLFPVLGWAEALVLAAVLTPGDGTACDPFLDSDAVPSVVTDTLQVENGLSDALVITAFSLGVGAAGGEWYFGSWTAPLTLLRQLGLGSLVGIAIGAAGAFGLDWGTRTGRFAPGNRQLMVFSLAVLAYSGAIQLDADGVVATFVAGLLLGNASDHSGSSVVAFAESSGRLLTLTSYVLVGVFAVPLAATHLRWDFVAYALLLITAVRLVPVGVSLAGCGLGRAEILSIAWFSPRTLPSGLLGTLLVERGAIAPGSAVAGGIALTVLVSVVLHGATSRPAAMAWRRRRAEGAG